MNSKETKYAGRLFKVTADTFLFYSATGNGSFRININTTILILSDTLFYVASYRNPCIKVLVLSGEHRGKVSCEFVQDIENKKFDSYKEIKP